MIQIKFTITKNKEKEGEKKKVVEGLRKATRDKNGLDTRTSDSSPADRKEASVGRIAF
jgi:hypothetical protein